MPILITGGAGVLGSAVASKLVNDGYKVRILDNFISGNMDNLASVRGYAEIKMGDVCRYEDVLAAMEDVSVVFHFAAETNLNRSWEAPENVSSTNIIGTQSILNACNVKRVKKIVLGSCHSIYGTYGAEGTSKGFPRSVDVVRPNTPIGISKLAAEQYCLAWHKQFAEDDMSVVILRFSCIYGHTRFSNNVRVMPRIIEAAIAGRPCALPANSNEKMHDFIHVRDAVNVAIKASSNMDVVGKVINVSSGVAVSYDYVVELMNDLLGNKINVNVNNPISSVKIDSEGFGALDNTEMFKVLGQDYNMFGLREGLQDVINKVNLTTKKG